jgi:hypothetical protein
MKTRFFLPVIAILLTVVVSCKKDAMYLQLPETSWNVSNEGQEGYICYHDASHASVLQTILASGLTQVRHGSYVCDGHRVDFTASDGSSVNLVRTFTHLKNSKNKNLSRVKPESWESVEGSVWTSLADNQLHVAYFPDGKNCVDISYKNVSREEGVPYGWDVPSMQPYKLDDSQLQAGSFSSILFKDFLIVNNWAAKCVNPGQAEEKGSSELMGTVWTYYNKGYPADMPAIIIFNSPTQFTRIMAQTSVVFEALTGTYSISGNRVKMTLGNKSESCLLSESSFTFFERTYSRMDY